MLRFTTVHAIVHNEDEAVATLSSPAMCVAETAQVNVFLSEDVAFRQTRVTPFEISELGV